MSEWIKCSEKLPPFQVYVLGYYCGGNWHDRRSDPNRIVVKRVDTSDGDEYNNKGAGYTWKQFGPGSHFAHDVSHWQALPEPPK